MNKLMKVLLIILIGYILLSMLNDKKGGYAKGKRADIPLEMPARVNFPKERLVNTGCEPKETIRPNELMPNAGEKDKYLQLHGEKNTDPGLLDAGYLIGVNTVGQSLRNANVGLRSEPPNPRKNVSIWNKSVIGPDLLRRPLE